MTLNLNTSGLLKKYIFEYIFFCNKALKAEIAQSKKKSSAINYFFNKSAKIQNERSLKCRKNLSINLIHWLIHQ